MCYFILTQRGTVVPRHAVQRVMNLVMGTPSVKEMVEKFDMDKESRLNLPARGYEGDKLNPEVGIELLIKLKN